MSLQKHDVNAIKLPNCRKLRSCVIKVREFLMFKSQLWHNECLSSEKVLNSVNCIFHSIIKISCVLLFKWNTILYFACDIKTKGILLFANSILASARTFMNGFSISLNNIHEFAQLTNIRNRRSVSTTNMTCNIEYATDYVSVITCE